MYTVADQGQTTPGDKSLMSTETSCHFSHLLELFKNISLKSDFVLFFFMILYMYIALGQRLTTPWRRNFDVNRNSLSLRSFVASFKQISLKSDFIQFIHDFIYTNSPGAGADSPQGTKFWFQQKYLVTSFICCKFKKKITSLKPDFIHFFFMI